MIGAICGGTSGLPLLKEAPKKYDEAYRALVPFDFKWRAKLGKVECNCMHVIESFEPWYGFTIYHSYECAIRAHLKQWPQMENFFWDRNPRVIAMSD